MTRRADIVIFGAGIAGLWAFNRFKQKGYDVLLLECDSIGGGQTIASQGIIHSGLKYAFAGKLNALAQNISAMPDRWRAALKGEGDVDLSNAKYSAESQYLLIPKGFMGGLVKLVTKQALGNNVHEVAKKDWPQDIVNSGFQGAVVYMDEPVLNIPSVIRALAQPYKESIRKIDAHADPFAFLKQHNIEAQHVIFTSAASNAVFAEKAQHDEKLKTQARPLLMGLMKPAPFELYAHLVGSSDKPVATITTHIREDEEMVWYLGGGVAEREKDAAPEAVYNAAIKGFQKYLPDIDLSQADWSVLPIDRIEGKSEIDGWMPDTPTIHSIENVHYCWPTKLTFAPLLAERLEEKIQLEPSTEHTDWSFLDTVDYTQTPWDTRTWTKHS